MVNVVDKSQRTERGVLLWQPRPSASHCCWMGGSVTSTPPPKVSDEDEDEQAKGKRGQSKRGNGGRRTGPGCQVGWKLEPGCQVDHPNLDESPPFRT